MAKKDDKAVEREVDKFPGFTTDKRAGVPPKPQPSVAEDAVPAAASEQLSEELPVEIRRGRVAK